MGETELCGGLVRLVPPSPELLFWLFKENDGRESAGLVGVPARVVHFLFLVCFLQDTLEVIEDVIWKEKKVIEDMIWKEEKVSEKVKRGREKEIQREGREKIFFFFFKSYEVKIF